LLGNCYWNMVPDLTLPPAGPEEPWDPARGLLLAQATYCYRRALELGPNRVAALVALHDAYAARQMRDAQQSLAHELRLVRTASGLSAPRASQPGVETTDEPMPMWAGQVDASRAIRGLLSEGRVLAAVKVFAEAEARGVQPAWPTRDAVAAALLHLGRPDEAHRVWERGADPTSPALQRARIAAAELASLQYAAAERTYREALKRDMTLGEAWLGLALLYTQRGDAEDALAAARAGLRLSLTPSQRSLLVSIESLVARSR
jgi:tetratricopeptide (TPR) repeat protein